MQNRTKQPQTSHWVDALFLLLPLLLCFVLLSAPNVCDFPPSPPHTQYLHVCLHAECGPHLRLSTEEVQKQTSHCNDRKTVSKRVQELSTELFFGVFVKVGRQIKVGQMEKRTFFFYSDHDFNKIKYFNIMNCVWWFNNVVLQTFNNSPFFDVLSQKENV